MVNIPYFVDFVG